MSFDYLQGKSVLVTGGTGSFGQACVRTLLEHTEAARIVIFSRDELKQTQMEAAIPDPEGRLRFFLGDIRDLQRLQRAFRNVDYVIHAAALKHVPILEYNPFEAVKTNILGTQNVINAAIDQNVTKVLLISTDKAANPANLYGATKLCAEKLVINGNFYAGVDRGTRFSVVRYGNVLGSRGSLIQLIKNQEAGGTLKITHEEMTRFWITIDEGVNLVLDRLGGMHGGEIFIPKIPSMKIVDVMRVLAPESKREVIGIRPGEKLHECLITPEEARHTKEFDKYFVIMPEGPWWPHADKYEDGGNLANDFVFTSQSNKDWLDDEGLKRLADELA